ncbi:MAG: hypothetical protein QM541_11590 [Flavobacterium sp.]|nr:hypothetical protein [Flavobacterium sp.]
MAEIKKTICCKTSIAKSVRSQRPDRFIKLKALLQMAEIKKTICCKTSIAKSVRSQRPDRFIKLKPLVAPFGFVALLREILPPT